MMEYKPLDSRALLKAIQNICPEVSSTSLRYFLLAEDHIIKCLLYGNNNTGRPYWPNHTTWVKNAKKFCEVDSKELENVGITKLAVCCSIKEITSIEERLGDLLDTIFYQYYGDDIESIKDAFVRQLKEYGVFEMDVLKINGMNDISEIREFLVNKAKNKGRFERTAILTNKNRDLITTIQPRLSEELDKVRLDQGIHFMEYGFETHEFYQLILNQVKYRLWIWGRKNKKLFDRSYFGFFSKIRDDKESEAFSFRCLFLDPECDPKFLAKAQKKQRFANALLQSVADACETIQEYSISPESVFKFYNDVRNDAIIVMDDIIFFANVRFDKHGYPCHITNSPFFITTIDTKAGRHYMSLLEQVWDTAIWHDIDLRGIEK